MKISMITMGQGTYSFGGVHLLGWTAMFVTIGVLYPTTYSFVRAFHLFFGFAWWGMLFFLNFILIPSMDDMTKRTKYEVLGRVFPRIFRTATVNGFMAASLGWVLALKHIANWDLTYFLKNMVNFLFLLGIVAITLLYCFHLFLERNEITTVVKALETPDDEEINKLIEHLKTIPRIGFTILTLGAILMFIH